MVRTSVRAWLIDDDEFEFDLMQRTIQQERIGFRLSYFGEGTVARAALEAAARYERPQIILCDIKMPGMDGFEFLRWLRASLYRCTPVIIRSNSERPADVTRAYELGANAYHLKPLHMDALAARLRATFNYWFACQFPDADCTQTMERVSRDAARRIGLSHLKILRVLGVGFKAEELEYLQTHPAFLKKLEAAAAKEQHEPDDLTELCRIGGEILARHPRS